ncbi:hypothetical protein ACFPTY_11540 [Halomonas beimenensis]|uniref:hypothetical protein n=1 Tax=Halomonas beimenensis TaxID=475662 RepID=UPI00360C2159
MLLQEAFHRRRGRRSRRASRSAATDAAPPEGVAGPRRCGLVQDAPRERGGKPAATRLTEDGTPLA